MHRTECQNGDCEVAIHVLTQTMEVVWSRRGTTQATWRPSGEWCGVDFADENNGKELQSEHDHYRQKTNSE